MRKQRLVRRAILVLPLLLIGLGSGAPSSAFDGEDRSPGLDHANPLAWIDRNADFFAVHEELQLPKGSSWKHFVKARRWLAARTVAGIAPSAADRLRAWEVGRARRAMAEVLEDGWFSIGPPNIAGRMVDLAFHPDDPMTLYAAAASGGLWITDDGGETWRSSTDGLPSLAIGAVCLHPHDPDIVLAATGEGINWMYVVFGVGIYKSTDGGETWHPTSLTHEITDNHGFHAMAANPLTGTILAGANDGLWRSTDQGDTWTRVLADGEYYDVKWKPGSATRVYAAKGNAASGNGIKQSDDDGLSWSHSGLNQPVSNLISKTKLAVTPADPSIVYAHYGDKQTHGTLGIYRSPNDGGVWLPRNTTLNVSGTQGSYAVTIAVDPDDPERVIAGGIKLYLSTDGGLNFTETGAGDPLGDETAVHWDHHAVAWEPQSTDVLWVGTDGGLWRSADSGETWSPRRDGLITTQYYDVCLDPNDPGFVMGGSQDNGLPWVEETDDPWFPSTLTVDGFACFVERLDPNVIYAEWQFGHHVRSEDRGQSWIATEDGLTGNARPFAPLDLDPNRVGRLFTSTDDGIFRSVDGQDSWERVAAHPATWISISPVDGDIVWTVNSLVDAYPPPVRFTTDDGATWTFAADYGFAVGNETKILAHPADPAAVFVTFAGYEGVAHVARSRDFGASWEDVSGDFPPDPVNTMIVDPVDPSHWFAGTDTGVWYSEDEGGHWTPLGAQFPNVVVFDLEIHRAARKLVAITYGRGTWEIDLPAPGGADVPAVQRHPDLMLDPPYPNPVSDRAVFRFASRRPGPVSLDIYDVRGRRVAGVARIDAADGIIRSAEWSARALASGVYFARLGDGDESVSRKLIVKR